MFDIHQRIHNRDDDIDDDRVGEYIDGLMQEFVASPEAQPVFEKYGDQGYAALMMQFAIEYVGVTPAKMSLRDFNEVVFELFPRKLSTEAENALPIVAELRAFWSFLHRQYKLANAPKILASLTDDAARRLEKDLANPANYGMAKSFFMSGTQAGFDMTTQKGTEAFMALYNSVLPGRDGTDIEEDFPESPFVLLPPPPLSHQDRQQKRKQRKAQRQARKRNRK